MKKLLMLSALVLVLGAGSIQANKDCGVIPGPRYQGEAFKCKDIVCPACPICPKFQVNVKPAQFVPEQVTQSEFCEKESCNKCHRPKHICKGTCGVTHGHMHKARRTDDMNQ